jgi:hypothetical protein
MVPMAIPTFGGMVVACVTWFVVPILYAWTQEWKHRLSSSGASGVAVDESLEQGAST